MIKIILAEDHLVVRNGIKLLLGAQEDLEVVGEANNGQEALRLLTEGTKADIVITDVNMNPMDGMELLDNLTFKFPDVKVLMLSMVNDVKYVVQAFEKGAKGYLVKNVGYDELLCGIRHVANGGRYVCDEMTMHLLDSMRSLMSSAHNQGIFLDVELSAREMEVLQLISEGYTNGEVADKLFLSKRTVEGHRQNLIDKFSVKNSAALIKIAVKQGLIT